MHGKGQNFYDRIFCKDLPGTRFLRASFSYMTDQLGLGLDEVVFEFCEAYLGCNYPIPPRMIKSMDKVAIITPIFTPYLEIPVLPEYDLDVMTIEVEEDLGWQLSKDSINQKEFGEWILNNNEDIDFLFTIAKECGVVLLPGNGFDDSHPSARVSLANLAEWQYETIGKMTRKVLDELYQKFSNHLGKLP